MAALGGGSMEDRPASMPPISALPPTHTLEFDKVTQDGCRPKRRTKIAQKPGKRDHTLCSVCCEIEQQSVTNSYCFECGRTMCEMCDLNHQQISAFRGHTKVSLCVNGELKLCSKKLEALICKDHDRMVRKYCWDCKKPVCNACLARKHHRHTIKAFAIKSEEDQEKYNQLQRLIHHKMCELEAKMEQIEAIKERHQQNFKLLEEKINSHTENVRNQVLAQEHQIRAELTRSQDEKRLQLKQLVEKANTAQRVMDSLMIQAHVARMRKAKLEAGKAEGGEKTDPMHLEPNMCKCCNKNVTVADTLAGIEEARVDEDEEVQDADTIMANYTFELQPHDDPNATLSYVKKISKVIGVHIDLVQKQVQQTKEEMLSLTFEPGSMNVNMNRIEIPELKLPDYEKELEEIRQLAQRLKSGSFEMMNDCVTVQEVSIWDSTGNICENPFK